jgi:hypothetical protein
MKTIIFAVDLGHFKAYKVSKDPLNLSSPKVDLIESYDSVEAHGKLSEKVSDSAGRFKQGTGAGFGEPHSMLQESEKRQLKQIAGNIASLLQKEKCEKWYLAAAKDINNQVIEYLDPAVKSKMAKNVKANLTNTAKAEILGYFEG